ncbi:MAG: hypothetical protein Kow00121_19300 [Elainellaceae cyanobacterium]
MIWKKKKPTLLLTVGTAIGLVAGGAMAWWFLQPRTPISELPAGAELLPQNTAVSVSFSTDAGQWRRLRQFGSPATQASFDQTLAKWRDRLFTDNGINYQQDVQPWVGEEITVAFLSPESVDEQSADSGSKEIRPYRLPNEAEFDQSAVMILPIANAERVQQFATEPNVTPEQEWADREYQGVTIREIHGESELDYAVAVLDNRFVVTSGDVESLEQVINTFQSKNSVARNADYGRAFSQVRETVASPFMRIYVNVPAAAEFTNSNANQPVPPQLLTLLQANQGLASAATLESEGMRFRGVTWIAPNSGVRLRTDNAAERMPVLLPAETMLMTSGGNFKDFWQTYSQASEQIDPASALALRNPAFRPEAIRQFFQNFTGLEFDKAILPWTEGEFALGLLSAPAASETASPTAGMAVLLQASDRRAADETFAQLDKVMQERNGWRVQEAQLEGQPVVTWTSQFGSLTVTRGWLEGNIVYLAIGPGVAEAVAPSPAQPLVDTELFRSTTATDLNPNNGHFFIAVDQLANPDISLPVPNLPTSNRDFLSVIRAIGLTTSVQDNRTTRFDLQTVIQKSDQAPAALPAPGEAVPSPAAEDSPPEAPTE